MPSVPDPISSPLAPCTPTPPGAGMNPLEGFVPSVPDGERLDFGSAIYLAHEERGMQEAAATAFVMVAGGLGERLGYSGV